MLNRKSEQNNKSEARIQAEIFNWYWNNFCLPIHSPRQMIYHVPNQKQMGLNNIGLYPGVADLTVIHNGRVYQVEIKEPGKGRQSDSQKKFEAHCRQSGIHYEVVTSLDQFQTFIDRITPICYSNSLKGNYTDDLSNEIKHCTCDRSAFDKDRICIKCRKPNVLNFI